jgi:SAM-dependent methyltransferase
MLTAHTADRHELYQRAVQDVARECRFLARTFTRLSGRRPRSLREDFCGTALLSAEWVKGKDRSAVGVDRDRGVLAWGRAHNLTPLGGRAEAVRLLRQDVRAPCSGPFDLAVALNFSYCVFRTREELGSYFAAVRRSLARDGLLVLDAYGGWQSWRPQTERRRLRGFTYVWEQARVDPIDHAVVNHIHFEFPDGSHLRRAFSYQWRLWSLPEIGELLAASGFARSSVWWEERDADGIGLRRYRRRAHAAQEPAWVAYVIAEVA